jgi:hypothetical protein
MLLVVKSYFLGWIEHHEMKVEKMDLNPNELLFVTFLVALFFNYCLVGELRIACFGFPNKVKRHT